MRHSKWSRARTGRDGELRLQERRRRDVRRLRDRQPRDRALVGDRQPLRRHQRLPDDDDSARRAGFGLRQRRRRGGRGVRRQRRRGLSGSWRAVVYMRPGVFRRRSRHDDDHVDGKNVPVQGEAFRPGPRTRTSIRRGALPSTSATAATPCASRLPAATPLREVGACLRSLPVEENERRRRPHRGGVPAQDLGPRCLVAGAVHGPAPCGLGGPDQGIADDDDARRRRDLPRRRLAEPTDTASRRGAGLRAANRRRAKPSTSADRSDPAKDGREPRGARDLSLRSGD